MRDAAPVLIAYDGSEVSRAAVRHAAELFPGRQAVLATVWESGLAVVPAALPGSPGLDELPPDPATVEAVGRAQLEHAAAVAAEPQTVPDAANVADTLIEIARERDAAVVVVGSHGISGLRNRLLGSVSRKLIEHCDRPVLVIRADSS